MLGVPTVDPQAVRATLGQVKLIDVRRPEEFNNELGHIAGSSLVTLGSQLTEFLESGDRSAEIVFICRSGARSATATAESRALGYERTYNMEGGMIEWNARNYPKEDTNE